MFELSELVTSYPWSALIVLSCYVVFAAKTKVYCYAVAYSVGHIYSSSSFFDFLGDPTYYLGYSIIYSFLLCYIMLLKHDKAYLIAVTLIIIFGLINVYDSSHTNSADSFIYVYYEPIFVSLHLLVICQSINWRLLRNGLGQAFSRLRHKLHHSDYFTRN